MRNLFKERKIPFLFTFFLLLIFVTFLLISNSQKSPVFIATDISQHHSETPISSNPIVSQTQLNPITKDSNPSEDFGLNDTKNDELGVENFNWKLCKGPVAVDYIPCLDNSEAIKALKSRRHMEHRERHCPDPSPRCLIPLPDGYKLPVPWPKSRDMVRLIGFFGGKICFLILFICAMVYCFLFDRVTRYLCSWEVTGSLVS